MPTSPPTQPTPSVPPPPRLPSDGKIIPQIIDQRWSSGEGFFAQKLRKDESFCVQKDEPFYVQSDFPPPRYIRKQHRNTSPSVEAAASFTKNESPGGEGLLLDKSSRRNSEKSDYKKLDQDDTYSEKNDKTV
eukprot:Trichotokara_eunicae@DN2073_c0_g1_i2.p2